MDSFQNLGALQHVHVTAPQNDAKRTSADLIKSAKVALHAESPCTRPLIAVFASSRRQVDIRASTNGRLPVREGSGKSKGPPPRDKQLKATHPNAKASWAFPSFTNFPFPSCSSGALKTVVYTLSAETMTPACWAKPKSDHFAVVEPNTMAFCGFGSPCMTPLELM